MFVKLADAWSSISVTFNGHPTFAEASPAVTQPAGTPAEISASKIVYSKEDDDAINEFHRRTGS